MRDLIEALSIFLKYKDEEYPTICEHDELYVTGVTEDEVSAADWKRLKELGFFWSGNENSWLSYRFGSA